MRKRVVFFGFLSIALIASSFASLTYETPTADAADTNTAISASVQHDLCWNIPGIQLAVPAGMVINASNDCYTPAPPPVDVCANIIGTQTVVPAGYYRDSSGNCYPQPTEPAQVDVCPNLDGLQTVVPDGYINNEDGDCVKPPVDQCLNIEGVQEAIPDGMTRDENGVCGTPIVPTPDEEVPLPTVVAENRQVDLAIPKNVPQAIAPIIAPIVKAVPEPIKQAVRSLPPAVAQSFPYFVFASLGALAVFLSVQAANEAHSAQRFIMLLKRERSIAEQKDNFIALASHYLRTPLTVMSNGLDAILALKEVQPELVAPLRAPIDQLGASISSILKEVEGDLSEADIEAPDIAPSKSSFLKSPHFWVPVAASVGVTALANFLFGIVGNVEIGTFNMITQIVVFITVGFFLYSALRNHYTRKRNRTKQEELLIHERTIDNTRNTFLVRSTNTLQQGLSKLAAQRHLIDTAPSARFFDDGFSRFATILGKFTLLSQIQAGAPIVMQPLNLRDTVDTAVARRAADAEAKQITLINDTPLTMVNQHSELFLFVLDSLLDNAIKFTDVGGTISIGATPSRHQMSVSITDTGIGIPSEKQSQLFKPFSRTESAVDFNYEGLGFSLFLDKIIMDYLGGDISVVSQQKAGSTFSITSDLYMGSEPQAVTLQQPQPIATSQPAVAI